MDHGPVLDEIVAWARGEENVRLVVVTGSLARGADEVDRLSDIDVELYVRDAATLLEHRDWYRRFGDVLLVEELENPGWHPTRLVYYVDGKIDFMIGSIDALEQGVRYSRPFTVLIDKDGRGERLLLEPSSAPPPSGEGFRRCIQWFWAAALMEAKAIVRDEPWMAKIRDRDLKEELLRMIEWDHRSRHGSAYDTWHLGVRMREWMDPDVQEALERCWAGFSLDETREALAASIDLFDRLGRRTAEAAGVEPFDAAPIRAEIDRILSTRRV